VRVSDGAANTDAAISLTVTEANAAPAIANVPASATIPELAPYTFTATATDADVPAQSADVLAGGEPAGASINGSTGRVLWTPTEAQGPGSYPFTVRVSDGTANTDAAITLTVTEVNAAPAIANVPATATIPELAAYTFTATATDSDVPGQSADVLAGGRADRRRHRRQHGRVLVDADRGAGTGQLSVHA
jgi:hypothetical protein